ncbi:MAG: DUF3090 domain-containing protein [Anaerolineales bacterium]|nr:DUF3090 domain-containing protein [Anaerolineales bacterium]
MAKPIELRPVDHITTDAIGAPGERVFYIQAWKDDRTVSLICEKTQIQSLAVGVEQFLAEINTKYADLADASADYDEDQMHIHPPVEPLFRVGQLGLGYDPEGDLVALELREQPEAQDPDQGQGPDRGPGDLGLVRFWCSRPQIRAMSNWGIEVASRGRPVCPQCGQPMDPAGHFCARKNGHKH